MSTLDNPNETIDPKEVSPWPTVLRFGLIGGLSLILYSLLSIITGYLSPSSGVSGVIINFLLTIVIVGIFTIVGVLGYRNNDLSGKINFRRAYLVGGCIIFIMNMIAVIFSVIYMNYIDPSYADQMINESIAMYEKMGLNEKQIEQAIVNLEESSLVINALKNGLLFSIVFSLIGGFFVSILTKN
ncbi:DUF4199 domain-containing protein [Phaeodactylibacter sp.]|uniref:DUF4199 domain-containing protein n=1 Tax=Phaeodactylibacter sp. TaxID=1940289 RepID=UPI0025CEF0B0|nr:DUF4199 domain-containing protein [Phaeodactylibacter sp.]MCI4647393.1 DUF4199 domain-containing protein [Phaeodactylibacter sp.]MCI5089582.1 DUF4199 domain-containing protein [Phaeodactylibacter sp.]